MNDAPTALGDLRIIEWSDEKGAWAGKLLADMGADVVKIEPPEGDDTRHYGPFMDDTPDPERSLWYWNYNTSKKSITLNLDTTRGRELFKALVKGADAVIESQPVGRAASLGIDYRDLESENPGLIWVSMTPFGRNAPRHDELATDLTLLAGGGIAWMNGYDDHSLPPVRGGGNQGYHTGSHYAVLSLLVALLHRDHTGEGQFVDVNMNAAINVTTEAGSYAWLVAGQEVQRQTGRHAAAQPSPPTQVQCADGRYVNLTFAARNAAMFRVIHDWLHALGLQDEFEGTAELLAGASRGQITIQELRTDPEVRAIIQAAREGLNLVAANVDAYEFFRHAQDNGMVVSIIYSPEEMLEDVHFKERGMAVAVEHPEIGRSFIYPGPPYQLRETPWRISRRAPALGEDNVEVYGALGLSVSELDSLKEAGVI
jgi:crotonobetainyl-CoA:carnitine CoA-transferase CaiB-like acyl-CoA transferase